MTKKQYNDYDDTLFGRYIRAIENPDSLGWLMAKYRILLNI